MNYDYKIRFNVIVASRHRDRHTDIHTHRQTHIDRQTHTKTDTHKYRHTQRQTHTQTDRLCHSICTFTHRLFSVIFIVPIEVTQQPIRHKYN